MLNRRHFILIVSAALLIASSLVGHAAQCGAAAEGEPCEGIANALLLAPFDANYDCRSLGGFPASPTGTAASRSARTNRTR